MSTLNHRKSRREKPATPGHFGFVRIATAVPKLRLGGVAANVQNILSLAKEAVKRGAVITIFPELCLTGYTLGDLFQQHALLDEVRKGLLKIKNESRGIKTALVLGLPVAHDGKLFNVAAVVAGGKICGLVPKTYIPGYKEFYEERWFSSARDIISRDIRIGDDEVPIGTDLIFRFARIPNLVLGVEICEDLWAPIPPSSVAAVSGATIIANLSASNEIAGKSDYRRSLVVQQSARAICGYAYVSSGVYESTTDVVFGGHAMISENGHMLAESERFSRKDVLQTADIDLEHLLRDRINTTSYDESFHEAPLKPFRIVGVPLAADLDELSRFIGRHPFVPQDNAERSRRTAEIFAIQAAGLATRMENAKQQKIILGLSGGLDSTLALLVALKTFQILGLPTKNIHAFSMPGFATSGKTKSNAQKLAEAAGVSFEEIDITATVLKHFEDIQQDPKTQDVTFENSQARYRTMILMDKSNQIHALLLGTGDLSEIALGWCTFSGDHISHYNVNAGVPKTLVRHIVDWASEQTEFKPAEKVLKSILATPISPELTGGKKGEIAQRTEDIIGPYELHDFFLYHFLRWGSRPSKILFLAENAFRGTYGREIIKKWLRVFITRFFANQWKRSVMPDGPKVGSVALSPRGDWRMPSDAEAELWLKELE